MLALRRITAAQTATQGDQGVAEAVAAPVQKGVLGWIERTGNRLPDPVFLFLYLIVGLMVVSVVASLAGWSAIHPTEVDETSGQATVITATSLLSAENIRRLWVEMPTTFTHFHPLGYVLVVMLGAGVAERASCSPVLPPCSGLPIR